MMARWSFVGQRQSRSLLDSAHTRDKNKLTSQVRSPKMGNIPSRVAEGLALRCHGNRFRESGTTRCQFQVRRVFEQRWRERRLCKSRDSWWDEPIDRPALIYG